MKDLISRQDAIEAVCSEIMGLTDYPLTMAYEIAEKAIERMPSAQPELVQNLHTTCTDTISRQAVIDEISRLINEKHLIKIGTSSFRDGVIDGYARVLSMVKRLPSAEGKEYIKWLEDKLCECEPVWLCEDNEKFTDWCYENCAWSSIQPQCLRHIFSVCGAKMEG